MTSSDQPMDHVPPNEDTHMKSGKSALEQHITARSTWLRFLFMIIFALLYGLSRLVTAAVVAIQFFYVLLTGATNEQLKKFGHSLAIYSFEIIDYLTFNTETKPYPLDAEWPHRLPGEDEGSADDDVDI